MALRTVAILIAITILAYACGARPAATPTSLPTSTAPRPTQAPTVAAQATRTPGSEGSVALAAQDLSQRLGIDASTIQVVSDMSTEMPLQGLGCGQPGIGTPQASAPAQVLGHEVTLQVGGQEYVYHVYAKQVVLCSGVSSTTSSGQPGNSDVAVAAALANLAGRLSLSSTDIQVTRVEPRDWPDASLGCPDPGKVYAQVITRGFLIVLEANGASYEYHTSLTEARSCDK